MKRYLSVVGCTDVRPCPRTECRYHIADGATPVCALDVAGEGPHTLDEVGEFFGVSRERVRQIEVLALAKLKKVAPKVIGVPADDLAEPWASGEANVDEPSSWFDTEFKRAVNRGYRRIVKGLPS